MLPSRLDRCPLSLSSDPSPSLDYLVFQERPARWAQAARRPKTRRHEFMFYCAVLHPMQLYYVVFSLKGKASLLVYTSIN